MQDYARMYPRRFHEKKATKSISRIKRLIMTGLPAEIILVLIVAIVMPSHLGSFAKR